MADERDDSNLLPEEHISDEISERVRAVLAAAESAATAIRHEAEQQAQQRRRAGEQERHRFLENAKAEAEAMLEERIKRISALSDSIIEGGEALLLRIEAADEVKRQFEAVLRALAGAAEKLAAESDAGAVAPPARKIEKVEEPPAPVTELRAAPEPDAEPVVTEVDAEPEADEGPAEPVDLKPVEVEPEADEPVDAEVEEDEPERDKPSAVQRLRDAMRGDNGTPAETEEEAPASSESSAFEGDEMLAARLVALQMAVAGSARVEVEAHLRKTFSIEDPAAILNDVFGAESKL